VLLTSQAFDAVLEVRFRQLPGHRKVRQKEYALRSQAMKKDAGQSTTFQQSFLPGQRIDMSMVFAGNGGLLSSCPGCRTETSTTKEELSSEVQW